MISSLFDNNDEDEAWKEIIKVGSFLKSFWSSVKVGTVSCLERIYMTGVTPISMTDHTSGFNIIENIF
jgi:hypothetical protein